MLRALEASSLNISYSFESGPEIPADELILQMSISE